MDVTAISAGIVTVTASGGGGGGINNLDEDTTPQLGGNLDLNGFNITGSGTIPAPNLTGALPAIDGSALTGNWNSKQHRHLDFRCKWFKSLYLCWNWYNC